MNEIIEYRNEQFGQVRTVEKNGEPWFCLSDVCNVLDLQVNNVVRRLEEGVFTTHPILDRLGRTQQANFVNEDGLYDVILDSRKPQARAFRKWITSEVLPSIRKKGSYNIHEEFGDSIKGDDELSIIKKKLECAEVLSRYLNLNEVSKLQMVKRIAEPLGLDLPNYLPSKGILKSATELLKDNKMEITTIAFNTLCISNGFLETKERESSHGTKKFKTITEKGKEFGENLICPNNPKETQPLWYENKFNELLKTLGLIID